MKKFIAAFTLAEILITLGIIGVVAAMTIPSIIIDYQKKHTVEALKKAYSTLDQALVSSIFENGEPEHWNLESLKGGNDFYEKIAEVYLIPYMKGVTKLKLSGKRINWNYPDGSSMGGITGGYPTHALNDGMLLNFWGLIYEKTDETLKNGNYYKSNLRITVDINGAKGPNRFGRDVFAFSLFPYHKVHKGKLLPGWFEQCGSGVLHIDMTETELLSNAKCAACASDHSGLGLGCSVLIMNNSWSITDAYPW